MTNTIKIEGHLNTNNSGKFAIVTARFNDLITSKLQQGAIDCLKRHGVAEENIIETWVPGAFELPLAALALANRNEVQGVICLGAVIRGATPHFDFVCSETAKGIGKVGLDTGKPVSFGVLTTDNLEQAFERAGSKAGNKGWEAAITTLEMVSLMNALNEK